MKTSVRFSIVAALVGVSLAGGVVAERRVLPGDRLLPGLRVGGEPVPDDVAAGDDAALGAWILARHSPRLDRTVEVRAGGSLHTEPLRALVVPLDPKPVVARLRAFGRDGALADRLDDAMRARRGEIDVPVTVTVDVEALEHLVGALKAGIDRPATDAKLDLAAHATIADAPGEYLELDGGVVALQETLRARALDPAWDGKLALAPLAVPARVTAADLGKIEIGIVLASFETHFGRNGDQAPRAVNIETAAKKLDGLVMQPGQLVSFNGVVGERSEANGFKVAWEIFKGEMRPGFGGGTCQVASTLHAASFFAGLDVLERLPHSRPSAYIPMGLDSTVVYPAVDLKLKNPWNFPVVVHTKVGQNTLTVEILGKEKPVSVVFGRDTLAVLPYERRLDEEPFVVEGKAIKKQGGIRGYRIRRARTLTALIQPLPVSTGDAAWPTKTEETTDFYPPTTEIYVVAPGTDPSALPPMPDDVLEALAKKKGEAPPEYATSAAPVDAVACAGECAAAPADKPKVEIQNAAGVHEATGDQAAPAPKVLIKQ